MLHRTVSLFMALLVLLSTVSWTVEKHRCMGRTMDVALFSHAEDCGMDMAMKAMDDPNLENPCCKDEALTLIGQDEMAVASYHVDLAQPLFVHALNLVYFQAFMADGHAQVSPPYDPPPYVHKDLNILHQVFLI